MDAGVASRCGVFDDEIGEVGGVEGNKSEREGFGEARAALGDVGERDGSGVDLVEVLFVVDVDGLDGEFNDGAESGDRIAQFGLGNQRKASVRGLADRGGSLEELGLDGWGEMKFLAVPHFQGRANLAIARSEGGFSPEDDSVGRSEDREEIVVVSMEEILIGEGIFALAGGALEEVFVAARFLVYDAGSGLDPEADGVPWRDSVKEREGVVEGEHGIGRFDGGEEEIAAAHGCTS